MQDSANVEDCSTLDSRDANESSNEIIPPYEDRRYPYENTQRPYDSRQTGCSSNPCRNDGQCYPLSPTHYKCNCVHGYRYASIFKLSKIVHTFYLLVETIAKYLQIFVNIFNHVRMVALAMELHQFITAIVHWASLVLIVSNVCKQQKNFN